MDTIRIALAALLALAAGCAAPPGKSTRAPDGFGVLVMAHAGRPAWNEGVLEAVAALRDELPEVPIEVAFGMADAAAMQHAVERLEGRGVRRIGVLRPFVSGESFYARTERILGLAPGAPARPERARAGHDPSMELWRIDTRALRPERRRSRRGARGGADPRRSRGGPQSRSA